MIQLPPFVVGYYTILFSVLSLFLPPSVLKAQTCTCYDYIYLNDDANRKHTQGMDVYISPDLPCKDILLRGAEQNSEGSFSLFSHGKPGYLLLDGKWKNAAEIGDWLSRSNRLNRKSHLNIYGCNFATGETGHAAVAYLEAALGVSVAASDDVTGVDGDWDLEVGTAHSIICPENYPYNLQISGTVFSDYNASGTRTTSSPDEPLAAGVVVTAYNSAGTILASYTTTSASAPNYSIPATGSTYNGTLGSNTGSVPSGTVVRLEFTNLPSSTYTGPNGTANATSVQFLTTPSTTASFGVNIPEDYAQSNPIVATPCFGAGTGLGSNTNDPAIVFHDYSASGIPVAYGGTAQNPWPIATIGQVGSVWGTASYREQKRLYAGTYLKRQSGMRDGTGYVYIGSWYSGTPSYVGKFNLQGVQGLDFGTVTRTTTSGDDNYLGDVPTAPSRDLDAFAKVGAVAMGDLAVDEANGNLWLVNLNTSDRSLAKVKLNDPSNPVPTNGATAPAAIVTKYALPTIPVTLAGGSTVTFGTLTNESTQGRARPFALTIYRGVGYLGVVTDASISKDRTKMKAYVLSFNLSNPSAGFTEVISFNLNYLREIGTSAKDQWNAWVSTWAEAGSPTSSSFAQPMLSNIEFTENGSMVLGFMDRFGDQQAVDNYIAVTGSTTLFTSHQSFGDIVQVCKVGGVFQLEGTGACTDSDIGEPNSIVAGLTNDGPSGTGEYYWEDYLDFSGTAVHPELALGGLSLLTGTNTVMSTFVDPVIDQARIFEIGSRVFNTTTGRYSYHYLLADNAHAAFNKGNGLGEPDLLLNTAPIEIGNRVWLDTDRDGVQDPGEPGIANVSLEMFADFDNNNTPDTYANWSCSYTGLSSTKAPGTGANNNCAGTVAWSNASNILTSNNTSATAVLGASTQSQCLRATDFGFSLPTTATIVGVKATIRKMSSDPGFLNVKDLNVNLLVGGSVVGSNLAKTTEDWTNTMTNHTYGGESNLWGTTLTPAQVNASNFGLSVRVNNSGFGSRTASIDYIELTIYYSDAPSGGGATQIFTTTTNSNGEWYFGESNVSNGDPTATGCPVAGLKSGGRYVVRVASADWTGGAGTGDLAGLSLTAANVGGSGQPDVRDSDAALVSSTPAISHLTGASGQNDHTLDMGFAPSCTEPSTITLTQTPATCTGATANNDGTITLTSATNADKWGISTLNAASYDGDNYASATAYAANTVVKTAVPNTGGTYILRLFNGADGCYKDSTVTVAAVTCTGPASCDCTYYLYLDDPQNNVNGFVHKFRINADGTFTEIFSNPPTNTQPWFPSGGGLPSPHGLVQDVNGNVYIGEASFGAGDNDIRKLTCNGTLRPETGAGGYKIDDGGYNIAYKDGLVYVLSSYQSSRINAYNLCDGSYVGYVSLNGPWDNGSGTPNGTWDNTKVEDWGLHIGTDGTFYATCGYGPYPQDAGKVSYIYKFTPSLADFTTNHPNISAFITSTAYPTGSGLAGIEPNGNHDTWGITSDPNGNFYVVVRDRPNGGTALEQETWVLKFNSAGTLIGSVSELRTNDNSGFEGARGIAYYAPLNKLYLGSGPQGDCISVINAGTMTYEGAAVGHVAGQNPKGLQLAIECCPTTATASVNETACFETAGEKFYLANLTGSNCPGPLCAAGNAWTADPGNSVNLVFNACDNSVTVNGAGCGTFTLTHPGGTNSCSAFSFTVNVCFNLAPSAITLSQTAPTCSGSTSNNNGTVTLVSAVNADKWGISTLNAGTYNGPDYASATAYAANTVVQTAVPNTGGTYILRLFNGADGCYKDSTITVATVTCTAPCSITATFTQGSCNNNGTTATGTDDYFTITVSAVSATNGGTSGKYEVILNGTVLNTGGTSYGTSVTVGTPTTFKSDGATTYQLKVRDLDIPSCETTVFTTTASAACSTVPCPPQICLPVTVTRN